jgi:hypothetical protein
MCWKHARSMMTVQVTRNELGAPDRPPAPADARLPQYAQALAQESVVRTWEFYRRSAVAAQGAANLLTDFVRSMLAATSDQAKEFVDLSARAAQHVIETMQGATVRLLRTEL